MARVAQPEETVNRFAEIVRRYCEWAEGPPDESDLPKARKLLSELYLAAIDLPELDCGEPVERRLTHEDYLAIVKRFHGLPIDAYSFVFEPFDLDDAPVIATLSDDLADIYRDIKEGLILYDEKKYEEAVWEWRFNFRIHWGRHLTSAQAVIHEHVAQNYP